MYTVVEVEAAPVGSGVGCSFWRRRLPLVVRVAARDRVFKLPAPAVGLVAFFRRDPSLCTFLVLVLVLLRASPDAVGVLGYNAL